MKKNRLEFQYTIHTLQDRSTWLDFLYKMHDIAEYNGWKDLQKEMFQFAENLEIAEVKAGRPILCTSHVIRKGLANKPSTRKKAAS